MSFFNDLFNRLAPPPDPARPPLTMATHDTAEAIAPFINSGNGHVRQAAVARCVAVNTAAMLPLLVSRLNDWVPQVRDAARAAIVALAPACPANALLAILPGVQRLHEARRSDHAEWLHAFKAILAEQMTQEVLRDAIVNGDAATSRASFHLARDCRLIDRADLIALALVRRHDIVMAKEAFSLIRRFPPKAGGSWYAQLATSPFLMLRVASLRAQLEGNDDAAHSIALAALRDKATGMRDVAMAFLRQHGFDLRGFYRTILLDAATPAKLAQIALVVLAGQGNKQDLDLVKSFLRAPAPAVRAAALATWLKLDPACKDDIAMLALRDPSPSLRRYAYDLVRRHGAYIPFDHAWSVLFSLHDDANLIRFAQLDPWRWLEKLVAMATTHATGPHPDAATAALLQVQAHAWRRTAAHLYAAPPPRHKALFITPAGQQALHQLGIDADWLN